MNRPIRCLSLDEARQVVRSAEGIADLYDRGYHWVNGTFKPAVRRLSTARRRADRTLASFGCYLLGDVHDFNHAPRAAIHEYQNCLALNPSEAAAWREIGTCYQEMGNYRLGRRALHRSLAIDPRDEHAKSELELLEEFGASSLYVAGDRVWQAAEYLARGRLKAALECLGRCRSTAVRLQRTRIRGAMGDTEGVMREWRSLDAALRVPAKNNKQNLSARGAEVSSGDWFFLPEALWNDPAFWAQQWRLRGRLFTCFSPPRCGDSDKFFAPLGAKLRFQLARTKRRSRAAAHLSDQYPNWAAARALAAELSSRRT